jgi:hypothetical protein
MDTDNTRDAAEPSLASAGSQPEAWANEDDDGIYEVGLSEAHAHYVWVRAATGKFRHRNPRIVPLYRHPQTTLTDAEREAVGMAYSRLTAIPHYEAVSATLRRLLERLG